MELVTSWEGPGVLFLETGPATPFSLSSTPKDHCSQQRNQ